MLKASVIYQYIKSCAWVEKYVVMVANMSEIRVNLSLKLPFRSKLIYVLK